MPDFPDSGPLVMMLQLAVPLWIMDVQDWTWEKRQARAEECGQQIAERGDHLMFRGAHTADTFNRLAEAVAILAYAPGGVSAFGCHWEAKDREPEKERHRVKLQVPALDPHLDQDAPLR